MGAAALVLVDNELAIHGTNNPGSVGGLVSAGCIRMHNKDIIGICMAASMSARGWCLPNMNPFAICERSPVTPLLPHTTPAVCGAARCSSPATAFQNSRAVQFATLAAHHAVFTATYSSHENPEDGELMAMEPTLRMLFYQIGIYTGHILKGAKPADLPVVQSSKFELVINAQTARILGLPLSQSLLSTADEIIA